MLNNFFLNPDLVNTVVEVAKQEISEGASSSIVAVSYSNQDMSGVVSYPKWSDDLEEIKEGLTLS